MTNPRSSSSASSSPPLAWFEDPGFDAPEPMTILDSGRVYGHAAIWGTCHVGIQGACVTPPRGEDYSLFRLGGRRTSDGFEVAVGPVTLGTSHAPLSLGSAETRRHYEDTGLAVADVAVGEDRYGPWFAGAIRRGVSEERIEELRAAKISGDWRADKAGEPLRLIALLACNTPGFPVPRPTVRVAASGAREALVASNIAPRSERLLAALKAAIDAHDEALATGELDRLLARARG